MNIRNSGNSYNIANSSLIYFCFVKTMKRVKFCDTNTFMDRRVVMIDNHYVLIYLNMTIFNFANTNSSNKLIVINCWYQHLCVVFRVSLRSRNIVNNTLKKRLHILSFIVKICNSISWFSRCIYKWTIQLFIIGFQINK